ADVEPGRYGADPAPETTGTVAFQDDLDIGVSRAVIDLDIPTLAICRGMQVLNVALGGTLIQHVVETEPLHHNAIHHVHIKRDSRLHAIVGAQTVDVSSYHHQAIDRPAPELVVTALASDGVVEAMEHRRADIVAV
ncbi:gamma-glutamyl-gamma-aminobutyrate hydrolase, partial [Mycobacterium sp. ITM-2017-0098]